MGTGVPFFFLHFHLKIEEKKKVGTPVNQASRRWLHHVGPTVSAWFFLLLLFPFARERRKRKKEEKEARTLSRARSSVEQSSRQRLVPDSLVLDFLLHSSFFSLLFPSGKGRREKRRVDGEVNPGGHVLGGRSPHTKKRKTSAQNTAQDRDFTIRYRPSPGLPQNIRIRGASGRSWTVSISSIPPH